MAANEKATGNVASKSHVFAQWKTPSDSTDALPGSKGTESKTDVELPGVHGDDEQTPQNKTVEHDLDNTVLSKETKASPTVTSATETKSSPTVMSETGNGHRANQVHERSGMQLAQSPSR